MNEVIGAKLGEIATLCATYRVARLELFGSAARDDFDPASSDLDFLVEFDPGESSGLADRYFGLLESLEALFNRPIDLVQVGAVKNPYLLQSIEASRTVLYAA